MEFDDKLERLNALTHGGMICLMKTDAGHVILAEVWKDGEMTDFYPFARYLTDDEIKELKMEGVAPEL